MVADLELRCPRCGGPIGIGENSDERRCPDCGYRLRFLGDYWDGRADGAPAEFAAQWRLWESGDLGGDTGQLYGKSVEQDFAEVLAILGLSTDDLARLRILEIGFGHGRILREIQKHCSRAYGVDLAKPLPSAKLRPRSIAVASLFEMPFQPGQFDLVICRGVIHHTPDARLAFTRIAEQVAPGGRLYLYIYEPNVPRSLRLRKLIPRSWQLPEWTRLLLARTLGAAWAMVRTATTRPLDIKRFRHHRSATTLGVFDVLSPRWTTQHPPDDVLRWFQEESLPAHRVSACNYVGARAVDAGLRPHPS
jgi:SAM-dependent methyltransferase